MFKTLKNIFLYLWQLPQNLLGLLLLIVFRPEETVNYKNALLYFNHRLPGGISLGRYIILDNPPCNEFDFTWIDIKHEYGHFRQSLYLGWLYLLVIGLPSMLGNIYDRVAHRHWTYAMSYKWYYRLPWERWADKLGGVER